MGISNSAFINTTAQISAAVQAALGTFVKVGETTLGAGAASISVASIPNTFKYLKFHFVGVNSNDVANLQVDFGAGTHYTELYVNATNGTTGAGGLGGATLNCGSGAVNTITSAFGELSIIQGTRVYFSVQAGTGLTLATSMQGSSQIGYVATITTCDTITISRSAGTFLTGARLIVYGVM